MLPETTYFWKFANGPAEISREELSGLLEQVELELHSSPLYQQILDNLHRLPEDIGNHVQQMVNAIGKAGVQLALRKLVTKKVVSPANPAAMATAEGTGVATLASAATRPAIALAIPTTPPVPPSPASSPMAATVATDQRAVDQRDPETRRQAPLPATERDPRSLASGSAAQRPPKRLNKREQAARAARTAWRDRLGEIGQELQQVRLAKALSLYQLHFKTQVPIHRLQSLEAGNGEALAEEDIYLRGFIRRVGDALGLDGTALAHSLPSPDPTPSVLPSWERSDHTVGKFTGRLYLGPVWMYVGYAALLTSGISWLSYQTRAKPTSPMGESMPVTPAVARDETPVAARAAQTGRSPTRTAASPGKAAAKGTVNLSGIAPPEPTGSLPQGGGVGTR